MYGPVQTGVLPCREQAIPETACCCPPSACPYDGRLSHGGRTIRAGARSGRLRNQSLRWKRRRVDSGSTLARILDMHMQKTCLNSDGFFGRRNAKVG